MKAVLRLTACYGKLERFIKRGRPDMNVTRNVFLVLTDEHRAVISVRFKQKSFGYKCIDYILVESAVA